MRFRSKYVYCSGFYRWSQQWENIQVTEEKSRPSIKLHQRQPLPQQAHHGILPPLFECDVIEIFRREDNWLSLANDSRDDAMLLQIDVAVDSPKLHKWSGSENNKPQNWKHSIHVNF